MITLHSKSRGIDYDELATLKYLALQGAAEETITISTRSFAEQLTVSTQTISRRLRQLENADLVFRTMVADGQELTITEAGQEVLWREFTQYQEIFEAVTTLVIRGTVTDGLGRGQEFIQLEGYASQFRDQLGYEPYAGTLNVTIVDDAPTHSHLQALSGIGIDSWSDDEKTYGTATCHPARIETENGDAYEPVHVLVPERTDHDNDQLELVGPVRFRDTLGLSDGDLITIHVR